MHPPGAALVQVKSNLGPVAPSEHHRRHRQLLLDRIHQAHPGGSADGPPDWRRSSRRKFVAEWLRQILLDGRRAQYNIEAAKQRDGVCIATLRRAKFDLGVLSTRESVSGAWYGALRQDQQPANQPDTLTA